MPRGDEVLLLTSNADVERAVTTASQMAQARVRACTDLQAVETQLGSRPVSVVLLDVDPRPETVLDGLEPLVVKFPRARFIGLCNELRSEVLLQAMQAGARHCLMKSSIATDLPGLLRRLLKELAPSAASGQQITVLSAGGGCGATTIAINLAEELREESDDHVMLGDLDCHYGALAGFLGLTARFGVADVLAHPGAIDDELVTSTSVAHSDGLSVLLGPAGVDFGHPKTLDWNRIDDLLATCSRAYPWTVIDAPRVPLDVAAKLAQSSTLTLVVFELCVTDIRVTRALLSALADRHVPPTCVLPVANRWQKRNAMLSLDDASQALGGIEVARISNDFAGAIRAINYGRPIAQVAPRSPLRADIQALVRRISAPAETEPVQRRTVA